jgi:hypothetical protein
MLTSSTLNARASKQYLILLCFEERKYRNWLPDYDTTAALLVVNVYQPNSVRLPGTSSVP